MDPGRGCMWTRNRFNASPRGAGFPSCLQSFSQLLSCPQFHQEQFLKAHALAPLCPHCKPATSGHLVPSRLLGRVPSPNSTPNWAGRISGSWLKYTTTIQTCYQGYNTVSCLGKCCLQLLHFLMKGRGLTCTLLIRYSIDIPRLVLGMTATCVFHSST